MAFLTPQFEMDAVCLHCKTAEHNKIYILWIEKVTSNQQTAYVAMAAWGKATNDTVQAQNRHSIWTHLDAARREIDGLVRGRLNKGYVSLMDIGYRGGLIFDEVLQKATIHNLSRADSYSTSTANVQQRVSRTRSVPTPPPVPVIVNPGQHCSRRLLET